MSTQTSEAAAILPLELLPSGTWARVEEVTGEPTWLCRMAELGLQAGACLQILRQGCPCLLQVGSSKLCLRNQMSAQILVSPLSAPV